MAELPAQAAEWIARGRGGDEAACAALYQCFSPAILRLCLGLLGNLEDAEEVLQDSFVYAFSRLDRYDPRKSAFTTWLYTIALSRCRNKRRRKWLAVLPLEQATLAAGGEAGRQVESLLERRGIRRQVWQALQLLPPRFREPVVLRYLAEMRYKEIGRALGCNPKTAESRVRIGVRAMRRTLQAWGVEQEAAQVELWA